MYYIVNLSGGLSSFEALRRTIERYGKENTVAVFADTGIEDPDLYQFLDNQECFFDIKIVRLADGRTPFDIWIDARAITMPNGAVPCSRILKREQIRAWIEAHFEPGTYTLVFGMEWSELHRMERLKKQYANIPVWFPLADPPYVDKCAIADTLAAHGIAIPSLYTDGFPHNNCGGGCVKAGQAQWAHLWRTRPDTYLLWEAKEQEFIEYIGREATILVDRRGGGKRKPMTLKAFRERLERGDVYNSTEWGGCGCFLAGSEEDMDGKETNG